MPATIWLIRHCQGLHNVTKNHNLFDPKLTDKGLEQGQAFWDETGHQYAKDVTLILASPSMRTIQTARLCFQGLLEDGQKQIKLDPDLMEGSDIFAVHKSNIPRPKEDILKEWNGSINLVDADALVTDEYRDRTPGSKYSDEFAMYHARAERARETIRRLADSLADDQIVAVVSHFHCLRWLIGDENGEADVHWRNCQMRPFRFQRDLSSREPRYHLVPASSPNPGSNGPLGLRNILERARAAAADPNLDPTKPHHIFVNPAELTWERSQELAREFAAAARGESGVAMTITAPEFQFSRDRLASQVATKARQLRRYVEIYKEGHGFPVAALEQAMVLHRGTAWIVAATDEQIWPEGWHPTNPDMPARRDAFLANW
ncbi:hypothetical protein PG989_013927 [Apiospora arundinis]